MTRTRGKRLINDISFHTPFMKMILPLIILWLMVSAGLSLAEDGIEGAAITSYGKALYWWIAAFSNVGHLQETQSKE